MSIIKQKYPSALLEDAVEAIGSLPGIGHRSALRLALHLLRQPAENVHHLTGSIDRLRDEVHYCRTCRMISDEEECSICRDHTRDRSTICVVESVRDVMSIENTGQYHGLYHVLGGIISPIGGIGPSDLTIKELVARISAATSGGDYPSLGAAGAAGSRGAAASNLEVILALGGDVEGETTAFYIYRQIAPFGVRVTTLARGLGFGDDLEYADELTLGRSIIARQPFAPTAG